MPSRSGDGARCARPVIAQKETPEREDARRPSQKSSGGGGYGVHPPGVGSVPPPGACFHDKGPGVSSRGRLPRRGRDGGNRCPQEREGLSGGRDPPKPRRLLSAPGSTPARRRACMPPRTTASKTSRGTAPTVQCTELFSLCFCFCFCFFLFLRFLACYFFLPALSLRHLVWFLVFDFWI